MVESRFEDILEDPGPFRCPFLGIRMIRVRCCLRQFGVDPLLVDAEDRFGLDARLEQCSDCALGLRVLAQELGQECPSPRSGWKDTPALISALRVLLAVNQEGLACILGVSQQTVSRWERGDAVPSLHYRRRMRDLYEDRVG